MKDKSRCPECGHNSHQDKHACSNCNCGESERISGSYSWRGYAPEASGDFTERLTDIYQSTARGDLLGERHYNFEK